MIIGKIAKTVLRLIMPDIVEHLIKLFKMDKLVSYMELPNEADRRIDKLEEQLKMMAKDADDVKDVIKRIKNKKAFKIG